jgi:hypothetical protein
MMQQEHDVRISVVFSFLRLELSVDLITEAAVLFVVKSEGVEVRD